MFHCIICERQFNFNAAGRAATATHTMGAACVMQKYRASSINSTKFHSQSRFDVAGRLRLHHCTMGAVWVDSSFNLSRECYQRRCVGVGLLLVLHPVTVRFVGCGWRFAKRMQREM